MAKQGLEFEAIGTKWSIAVQSPLPADDWPALQMAIQARIEQFDQTYSRFREDSWVTRLSRSGGTTELPAGAYTLLNFYEKLYWVTDGAVTPLIGSVMVEAGYDADYSLRPGELHQPPVWGDVIAYDEQRLTLSRPALLDFGAAGKGYLIDIVGGIIEAAGATSYVINAGGDIRYRSAAGEPLTVGLENPLDTTEVVGTVPLTNASLCASSGARRQWQGFHHIIDPHTLASPKTVLATWTIAADTMTADGLSTALYFVDPARLSQEFEFDYAVLHHDMGLTQSRNFVATLFTEENT